MSRNASRTRKPSRELAQELLGFLYEDGLLAEGSPLEVLHQRESREEFEIAAEFCASKEPLERIAGALILGGLGVEEGKFASESVDLLIPMLEDQDVRVIDHAAVALGQRRDPRAVPHLAALDGHPDESVRHAVVLGLAGQEDPKAIASLIKLAKDEDHDVRNYAIFSLGSQIKTDTRRIRQVLCDAMTDEDDEIMGEAMVGLAARGDERVIPALLRWWKKEPPFGLTLEAAALIASPQLVPPLEMQLEKMNSPKWNSEHPDWKTDLTYALRRCKGEVEPR